MSSRVGSLNLDWVDPDQSSDTENEAFQRAMTLAGSEFLEVSQVSFSCVCVCYVKIVSQTPVNWLAALSWAYIVMYDWRADWKASSVFIIINKSLLFFNHRVFSSMQNLGYQHDQL